MTNCDQPLDLSLRREKADGAAEQHSTIVGSIRDRGGSGNLHSAESWHRAAAGSTYAGATAASSRPRGSNSSSSTGFVTAQPEATTTAAAATLAAVAQLGSGSTDRWRLSVMQARSPVSASTAPVGLPSANVPGTATAAAQRQASSSRLPLPHGLPQQLRTYQLASSGSVASSSEQLTVRTPSEPAAAATVLESTLYRSAALAAESRTVRQQQEEMHGGVSSLPAHHLHGPATAAHWASLVPPSHLNANSVTSRSAEMLLYEMAATARDKSAYKPAPEQSLVSLPGTVASGSGVWYGSSIPSQRQLSPGSGLVLHGRAHTSSKPYSSTASPVQTHQWEQRHQVSQTQSHGAASKRTPPAASANAPLPSPGSAGLAQDLSYKDHRPAAQPYGSGSVAVGSLPLAAHSLDLGRLATGQPVGGHVMQSSHVSNKRAAGHRQDLLPPQQQPLKDERRTVTPASAHSKLSYYHHNSPRGDRGAGSSRRLSLHESHSPAPLAYDSVAAYARSAEVQLPSSRSSSYLQRYPSNSVLPEQASATAGRCGSAGSDMAASPTACRLPGSITATLVGSAGRHGAGGPYGLPPDVCGGVAPATTTDAAARVSAGALPASMTSSMRVSAISEQLLSRQPVAAEEPSALQAMRTLAARSGGSRVDFKPLAPEHDIKAPVSDILRIEHMGHGGSSADLRPAGLLSSGTPMKRPRPQPQQPQQHDHQLQPHHQQQFQHDLLRAAVVNDLRCRSGSSGVVGDHLPSAAAADAGAAAVTLGRRWGDAQECGLPSRDSGSPPLALSLVLQPQKRDAAAGPAPWLASSQSLFQQQQFLQSSRSQSQPPPPRPLSPQCSPICLTTTSAARDAAWTATQQHALSHCTNAAAVVQRARSATDAMAAAARLNSPAGYDEVRGSGVRSAGEPEKCKRRGHGRVAAAAAATSPLSGAAGLPYSSASPMAAHSSARALEGRENASSSGVSSRIPAGSQSTTAVATATTASDLLARGGSASVVSRSSPPGMPPALPLTFPSRVPYLTLAAPEVSATGVAVMCTTAAAVTAAAAAALCTADGFTSGGSCGFRAVTTTLSTTSVPTTTSRLASKVIPVANVQPFFKNILSEAATSSASTALCAPTQVVPHKPALCTTLEKPRGAKDAPSALPEGPPLCTMPAYGVGGSVEWQIPLQKPATASAGRMAEQLLLQQEPKLEQQQQQAGLPLLAADCRESDRSVVGACTAAACPAADAVGQTVPSDVRPIEKLEDNAERPCAEAAVTVMTTAATACEAMLVCSQSAVSLTKAAARESQQASDASHQLRGPHVSHGDQASGTCADEGALSLSSASSNLFKRLSQHQKDYSLHPKKRPYVADCDRAGTSAASVGATSSAPLLTVAGVLSRREGGTAPSSHSLYSSGKRKKRSLLDEIANTEGYVAESDRLPDKRRKLRLAARQSFTASLFGSNSFKMTQKRRQQLKAKAAMLDASSGLGSQPDDGSTSMVRVWSAKAARNVTGYRRGRHSRHTRATVGDPKRLRSSAGAASCRTTSATAAALEEPAVTPTPSSARESSALSPVGAAVAADDDGVNPPVDCSGYQQGPGDDGVAVPSARKQQQRKHGLFRSRGCEARAGFGGGVPSSYVRRGRRVAERLSLLQLGGSSDTGRGSLAAGQSRKQVRTAVGGAHAAVARDHRDNSCSSDQVVVMVTPRTTSLREVRPCSGRGRPAAADRCLFEFSSFYLPVYSRAVTIATGVSEFVLLQDVVHCSQCLVSRDRLVAVCGSPSSLSMDSLRELASFGGTSNAELAHRDDVTEPVEIMPYTRNLRRLLGIRSEVVRLDRQPREVLGPPMETRPQPAAAEAGSCSDSSIASRQRSSGSQCALDVDGSGGWATRAEDDADSETSVANPSSADESRTCAATSGGGRIADNAEEAITTAMASGRSPAANTRAAFAADRQKLCGSSSGRDGPGIGASSCMQLPSIEQQLPLTPPTIPTATSTLSLALSCSPHTQPTVTLQRLSRQLLVSCSAEGSVLAPLAPESTGDESTASTVSSRDCRPVSAGGSPVQADRSHGNCTSVQLQQQQGMSPAGLAAASTAVDTSRSRNHKGLTLSLPLSLPLTYCQQHKLTCDGPSEAAAVVAIACSAAAATRTAPAVNNADEQASGQQQPPVLAAPELCASNAATAAAEGLDHCESPMLQLEDQSVNRSASPTVHQSASPAAVAATSALSSGMLLLPPPATTSALLSSVTDDCSMPTLTPVYADDKAVTFSHF